MFIQDKAWKFLRVLAVYDLWLITTTALMLFASVLLIASAGSAVAVTHNWSIFFFIKKHLVFCIIGLGLCAFCATMDDSRVMNFGLLCLVLGVAGVICTFFIGTQIKGAYRWLNVLGFSLQPSEIMKVGCIMVCSRLISKDLNKEAIIIFCFCAGLLLIQPDFGSLIILSSVIMVMAFINGLRAFYIACSVCLLLATSIGAYLTLPHVVKRVEIFLNKTDDKFGNNYQIIKATEAFKSGGLTGKGPGEGYLKYYLPDAHADFIFAVVGEEFGLIGTLLIVSLYFIFLVRIFSHTIRASSSKKLLLLVGLGGHLLLQSWFNVMSNLALIPTKGFTLPIIGYGGSGLIMSMCSIGIILGVTRKQIHSGVLEKFD